jgi:hypothetical protein
MTLKLEVTVVMAVLLLSGRINRIYVNILLVAMLWREYYVLFYLCRIFIFWDTAGVPVTILGVIDYVQPSKCRNVCSINVVEGWPINRSLRRRTRVYRPGPQENLLSIHFCFWNFAHCSFFNCTRKLFRWIGKSPNSRTNFRRTRRGASASSAWDLFLL